MHSHLQSKVTLLDNEPLSRHSTFRIGGPALFFASPQTREEIKELVDFAEQEDLPVFVLGGGSNVLFADRGFPGLVIGMGQCEKDLCEGKERTVVCAAGMPLSRVVTCMRDAGLSGLEFLYCIPGTVGGAIKQNASYGGVSVADCLERMTVFDMRKREQRSISRADIDFDYRICRSLGTHDIILDATFRVFPDEASAIALRLQNNVAYRKKFHDMSYPSLGCIFKNPVLNDLSAGQLIEQCEMKGYAVGDARVSDIHANYIVNVGRASADDVLTLIDIIRRRVKETYAIDLTLEIEYVS